MNTVKKTLLTGIFIILATAVISLTLRFVFFSEKGASNDEPTEEYIRIERTGENVITVHLASDAVTAVNTSEGIVVFDAGITPSLTYIYRKIIEKEFGKVDFAYLINTHSHHDHTGGNAAFEDAVIIGHANCLEEMAGRDASIEKTKEWALRIIRDYEDELKELNEGEKDWEESTCQRLRFQHLYNDISNNKRPTLPPEITFTDSLSLTNGGITLNMIYFGKAHSGSDIMIHIPELKTLLCGDLFSPGGKPAFYDQTRLYPARWMQVMDRLMAVQPPIETVIGGHGQIMSGKDLAGFYENLKRKNY